MLEQGNQCDHGMSYEERPADGRTAIKRIFGATDSRPLLSLKSVEIFSKSIKFLSRMYPISYKHANACYKIQLLPSELYLCGMEMTLILSLKYAAKKCGTNQSFATDKQTNIKADSKSCVLTITYL